MYTFICVDRKGIHKGQDKEDSGLAAKSQKPRGAREGGWRRFRGLAALGCWRAINDIREVHQAAAAGHGAPSTKSDAKRASESKVTAF
jgi:hypothetical protein